MTDGGPSIQEAEKRQERKGKHGPIKEENTDDLRTQAVPGTNV